MWQIPAVAVGAALVAEQVADDECDEACVRTGALVRKAAGRQHQRGKSRNSVKG